MATPTPPRPTDYERIASRYNLAREAPTEWVEAWRVGLAPLLRRSVLPMLDVGSGTGYWATALADWFSLEVVAVEPSRAMRREALENGITRRSPISAGEPRAFLCAMAPATAPGFQRSCTTSRTSAGAHWNCVGCWRRGPGL